MDCFAGWGDATTVVVFGYVSAQFVVSLR